MDNFGATTKKELAPEPAPHTCHAVFQYFFSDDRKQYASANVAHRKLITGFLKQHNIMSAKSGKIWENTDGRDEN